MNNKYIYYNLEEIQEEIEIIMKGLKNNPQYSHDEFYKSMQHLFHHANIAWNARHTTSEEVEQSGDAEILKWSQFPTDIRLI